MKKTTVKKGEIVQLNPETVRNKAFAACLAVVDEPKDFGAQVVVLMVGTERDQAPPYTCYRARWDEMEPTGGMSVWTPS